MSDRSMRLFGNTVSILLLPAVLLFLLGGCGGSSSSGTAASGDVVRVSLSQAPDFPAGAVAASALAGTGDAETTATQGIDNVWITIDKVALIPGGDSGGPDPAGEVVVQGSGTPAPGLLSASIEPTEVDLLHLPAGQFALFLNEFDNVPAGTYGKIRLYYSDPKVHFSGADDNAAVHPTANFHLDIHFVGGDLVIPVSTNPSGGVRLHEVNVVFVLGKDGLKVTVNPNKILLRPQVFATVSEVLFAINGVADNVDAAGSSFDIATADGRAFHVVYGASTAWFFRDPARSVSVGNSLAIAALRDTAIVEARGAFSATLTLQADSVLLTFPLTRAATVFSGTPASGWLPDNTFVLNLPTDNVVIPRPDRQGAFYDNNVSPFDPLTDLAIRQGVFVTARGYSAPGGVEAFWISVGP